MAALIPFRPGWHYCYTLNDAKFKSIRPVDQCPPPKSHQIQMHLPWIKCLTTLTLGI